VDGPYFRGENGDDARQAKQPLKIFPERGDIRKRNPSTFFSHAAW
jgi:hypothetical protein